MFHKDFFFVPYSLWLLFDSLSYETKRVNFSKELSPIHGRYSIHRQHSFMPIYGNGCIKAMVWFDIVKSLVVSCERILCHLYYMLTLQHFGFDCRSFIDFGSSPPRTKIMILCTLIVYTNTISEWNNQSLTPEKLAHPTSVFLESEICVVF